MSRPLNFSVAGPQDDAELRALLRKQCLPGWVSLSFEREPDYFAAAAIEGPWHRVLVARESKTGALVGFCVRVVRRVFVNGEVQSIGYLGQLRADPGWLGSYRTYRALSQGFSEVLSRLRHKNDLPFDLTSILADNHSTRRMLEAGLPGMPRYQRCCGFNTLIYRCGGRTTRRSIQVENGSAAGLAAISDFLQRSYRSFQFSPLWDEDALTTSGLTANDFLLLRDNQRITACVAIWDQRCFKQTVVQDYQISVKLLRPLLNLASPLLNLPRLPDIGETVKQGWLSHLACDENEIDRLQLLLSSAFVRARKSGLEQVMLGLSDDHPLLSAVRRSRRHLNYRSELYLVHWGKNDGNGMLLNDSPVHVELATL